MALSIASSFIVCDQKGFTSGATAPPNPFPSFLRDSSRLCGPYKTGCPAQTGQRTFSAVERKGLSVPLVFGSNLVHFSIWCTFTCLKLGTLLGFSAPDPNCKLGTPHQSCSHQSKVQHEA